MPTFILQHQLLHASVILDKEDVHLFILIVISNKHLKHIFKKSQFFISILIKMRKYIKHLSKTYLISNRYKDLMGILIDIIHPYNVWLAECHFPTPPQKKE